MVTNRIYIWDIFVRVFHWTVVVCFTANAFFTHAEGQIHRWVGYIIAGALVLRIVWGFLGSRYARFASFMPSVEKSLGQLAEMASRRRVVHAGHSPLGALMIYNLAFTLAGICVSGYMMTTVAYFGIEWVEDVHKALVNWAEISAALHITAVLFESVRLHINLPKSMLTGYKDIRRL